MHMCVLHHAMPYGVAREPAGARMPPPSGLPIHYPPPQQTGLFHCIYSWRCNVLCACNVHARIVANHSPLGQRVPRIPIFLHQCCMWHTAHDAYAQLCTYNTTRQPGFIKRLTLISIQRECRWLLIQPLAGMHTQRHTYKHTIHSASSRHHALGLSMGQVCMNGQCRQARMKGEQKQSRAERSV